MFKNNWTIHLCLFFCLAYRVIVTIFLNAVYICLSILYWCLSFWLTSLCIMGSSFIHLIRTNFWTLWEKARVGWSERIALKHVYYQVWNRLPVQVGYMRQPEQCTCSGLVHWDDPEGWDAEGGGKGDRDGEHM